MAPSRPPVNKVSPFLEISNADTPVGWQSSIVASKVPDCGEWKRMAPSLQPDITEQPSGANTTFFAVGPLLPIEIRERICKIQRTLLCSFIGRYAIL